MRRSLFGGAMSIDIPERLTDVSNLRQVPDHQEVFADAKTDESVIIEILEAVDKTDGIDAIQYHYKHVCELNNAPPKNDHMSSTGPLKTMPHAFYLFGEQTVAKFNEKSALAQNTVAVHMAL
ncbi:hypothetical protein GGI21_005015, partial [Coemansia aciculifera]